MVVTAMDPGSCDYSHPLSLLLKNCERHNMLVPWGGPERPRPDNPLFKLGRVIVTPHAAFYSEESLIELQTKAAQEVARVLSGRRPINVVNPEVLPESGLV